jgi:hypothetical protein
VDPDLTTSHLRLTKSDIVQFPHVEWFPERPLGAPTMDHGPSDALGEFLAASRSWTSRPVPLSGRTTTMLWALVAVAIAVGAALLTVVRHPQVCDGVLCSAATLGGRPSLTLALNAAGIAGLLWAALVTRGLTQANGRQLALVIATGVVTFLSVVGAVIVAALVVSASAVLLLLLACVIDRN